MKILDTIKNKISGTLEEINKKIEDNKFTPDKSFDFMITKHFRYGELTKDRESRRFLHQYQCDTALELCKFLEKLRASKAVNNRPIRPTSGHRPYEINAKVSKNLNSEHIYNKPLKGAIDISCHGSDMNEVYKWLDANWPQSLGDGRKKGFIHIGMNTRQIKRRWDY